MVCTGNRFVRMVSFVCGEHVFVPVVRVLEAGKKRIKKRRE